MSPENTTIAQIIHAENEIEVKAAALIEEFHQTTGASVDEITPFTNLVDDDSRFGCTSVAVNADPVEMDMIPYETTEDGIAAFKEAKWQLEIGLAGIIQGFEAKHGVTVDRITSIYDDDGHTAPTVQFTLSIDPLLGLN